MCVVTLVSPMQASGAWQADPLRVHLMGSVLDLAGRRAKLLHTLRMSSQAPQATLSVSGFGMSDLRQCL